MAQTKQELLNYFAGLDIPTLQRLQKYSTYLIIPEEDTLTDVNMSQMVDKAHQLADSLFPEWTDRSKSDFGEYLIELFALFSEKDFWYINAFANEGTLRKMRSYSNAFSKAISLGYTPVTCKGATSSFSVTFLPGGAVTYRRGDIILEVKGKKFTNDSAFTVPTQVSNYSMTLSLLEGTQVAEDVTFNGYNVFVRRENVDINSINVIIDNIIYTRVKTFGQSSANSPHYVVLPEEDGSVSIHFGDGTYGIHPEIGKNIRVEYRKCSGSEGNISVGTCSVLDSLPERNISSAVMLQSSTGGINPESLQAIKETAPLYFSNKRAAINETVSEEILNGFSFIHKSKVVVTGRQISYQIIPTSGASEPSAAELSLISAQFSPYIMGGYQSTYAENQYVNLISYLGASKFIVDVIASPGYSKSSIENSVRQILEDLTDPLIKANYGGSFLKADADILMRSAIPGVQSCTFKMLSGVTTTIISDVLLAPTEIFSKIANANVNVNINVL